MFIYYVFSVQNSPYKFNKMTESNERIRERINIAAYYLAQMKLPYDTLCWMLAERKLYVQNNFKKTEKNFNLKKKLPNYFYS